MKVRAPWGWLRTHLTLGGLSLFAIVTLGLWVFAGLLDEVREGSTGAFDKAVLMAFRVPGNPSQPIGPPALQEVMRDFTALGGVMVLTLLTAVVAGFMLFQRQVASALYLVATAASGILVSTLLKNLVDRPRPDLVPHGSVVSSASFPSGHSMMAAVVYLLLAMMIARQQKRHAVKVYVLTVAVCIVVAVGISRVYLGVHWPTDVIAGWSLGAAWSVLCWMVAEALSRRALIQSEDDEGAPR